MRSSSLNPKGNKSLILAHLCAIVVVTVWGLSFVFTKVLTEPPCSLDPVEIYMYRFALAYVIVLAMNHKRLFADSLRDELLFVVCGLCGGSIYFIAENIAVTKTLVGNVSLITTLAPLLTTFLIGAIYKSERPSRWTVMGSFVAFMGVGCVIFGSTESGEIEVHPMGDFLAFAAAFSFAIYSVVLRKLNVTYGTMFITRKTFFYGLLTAVPFMAMVPEYAPLSTLMMPQVWGNILFLGLLCSLIAYVFWAQSIKTLGAVSASNYLYGQPIVTLIAGWVILGEPIGIMGWVGCALIIGGLWFGDYYTRKVSMANGH